MADKFNQVYTDFWLGAELSKQEIRNNYGVSLKTAGRYLETIEDLVQRYADGFDFISTDEEHRAIRSNISINTKPGGFAEEAEGLGEIEHLVFQYFGTREEIETEVTEEFDIKPIISKHFGLKDCIVEFDTPISNHLIKWVLSQGRKIKVIAPQATYKKIQKELSNIGDYYYNVGRVSRAFGDDAVKFYKKELSKAELQEKIISKLETSLQRSFHRNIAEKYDSDDCVTSKIIALTPVSKEIAQVRGQIFYKFSSLLTAKVSKEQLPKALQKEWYEGDMVEIYAKPMLEFSFNILRSQVGEGSFYIQNITYDVVDFDAQDVISVKYRKKDAGNLWVWLDKDFEGFTDVLLINKLKANPLLLLMDDEIFSQWLEMEE